MSTAPLPLRRWPRCLASAYKNGRSLGLRGWRQQLRRRRHE
ncbi:MAG: hypothetical protein M5U34_26050 [Chloroflexi bacterium]|nr:hypothetical protein [Chloroflexota bacterium]